MSQQEPSWVWDDQDRAGVVLLLEHSLLGVRDEHPHPWENLESALG